MKNSRFSEIAAGDWVRSALRGRRWSASAAVPIGSDREFFPSYNRRHFLNVIRFPENETARESDMSDPKMAMEGPPQVRDFAVKSVDQAQRAISSFMESASKSVAMVPGPMTDAAKEALEITEKNLKLSLEHARKLMNAKDINEVMQLQTEFLRNQFGITTEQITVPGSWRRPPTANAA